MNYSDIAGEKTSKKITEIVGFSPATLLIQIYYIVKKTKISTHEWKCEVLNQC